MSLLGGRTVADAYQRTGFSLGLLHYTWLVRLSIALYATHSSMANDIYRNDLL